MGRRNRHEPSGDQPGGFRLCGFPGPARHRHPDRGDSGPQRNNPCGAISGGASERQPVRRGLDAPASGTSVARI